MRRTPLQTPRLPQQSPGAGERQAGRGVCKVMDTNPDRSSRVRTGMRMRNGNRNANAEKERHSPGGWRGVALRSVAETQKRRKREKEGTSVVSSFFLGAPARAPRPDIADLAVYHLRGTRGCPVPLLSALVATGAILRPRPRPSPGHCSHRFNRYSLSDLRSFPKTPGRVSPDAPIPGSSCALPAGPRAPRTPHHSASAARNPATANCE